MLASLRLLRANHLRPRCLADCNAGVLAKRCRACSTCLGALKLLSRSIDVGILRARLGGCRATQAWGCMEHRQGNLERARELFQSGIWAEPGSAAVTTVWQAWAVLEAQVGNHSLTRQLFKCAVKADPSSSPSWLVGVAPGSSMTSNVQDKLSTCAGRRCTSVLVCSYLQTACRAGRRLSSSRVTWSEHKS